MVHVACLATPFYSHLRVFEALAGALVARGHRVTFLVNSGAGALLRDPRFPWREAAPAGRGGPAATRLLDGAARPTGPFGVLRTVADMARLTGEFVREGPRLLEAIGAEAILGDEAEPAAGLLAERFALPHVSVSCGLPLDPDPALPLPFLDWPFDPSEAGLKRNRGGRRVARLLLGAQRRAIRDGARTLGLPERDDVEACASRALRLSQTVAAFDFPHAEPPLIRGVGPIRPVAPSAPSGAPPVLAGGPGRLPPLPEGRPVVFASLGTMQGHRAGIFRAVARACRRLGATSVIAHCGRLDGRAAARLGADVVGDFFPLAPMLARADACVTHAGLNTVLDALEAGRPLLAVPIAFDQPGVAARVLHHGAGLSCSRVLLSATRVENALERLLGEASFAASARRLGEAIRDGGGTWRAVDLIEDVFGRGRPSA